MSFDELFLFEHHWNLIKEFILFCQKFGIDEGLQDLLSWAGELFIIHHVNNTSKVATPPLQGKRKHIHVQGQKSRRRGSSEEISNATDEGSLLVMLMLWFLRVEMYQFCNPWRDSISFHQPFSEFSVVTISVCFLFSQVLMEKQIPVKQAGLLWLPG